MITLSGADVALVYTTLALPDEVRDRFARAGPEGIVLNDDDVDLLVELATDRLMAHGFDAAYRPTEAGVALERLIDRLTAEDEDSRDNRK